MAIDWRKIKISERGALLALDFHLISILAVLSFIILEKIWPGIIDNYLNPSWLVVYWLISLTAFCFFTMEILSPIHVFFGCLAAAAVLAVIAGDIAFTFQKAR
jgi:hypothetical protein